MSLQAKPVTPAPTLPKCPLRESVTWECRRSRHRFEQAGVEEGSCVTRRALPPGGATGPDPTEEPAPMPASLAPSFAMLVPRATSAELAYHLAVFRAFP